MEYPYFNAGYKHNVRLRWICQFLRFTGFVDLDQMRRLVDEKIARIENRRGSLDEAAIGQIAENLIWARIAKRFLDRRLKLYETRPGRQSPTHAFLANFPGGDDAYRRTLCPIYKEKSYRLRANPSILFPGFLPEGNEAFFLLRKCFLKFGSVYYMNYPMHGFNKETIFHQVYDLIKRINERKLKTPGKRRKPFLVGTSFGCHIITSFLDWLRKKNLHNTIQIQGIVLISPVICQADVVDTEATRQRTLVGRAFAHLADVDQTDQEALHKALAKAKSIFIKMFSSGRDLMKFESKDLIPVFAIEDEVLAVFRKELEEDEGYFIRFLELKRAAALEEKFLTNIPTLVLFAEGEEDVLTPNSPTMASFSDIETLRTIFPSGAVEFVYSKSKDRKVTHSDLVFQASRFAEHLDPWMRRFQI